MIEFFKRLIKSPEEDVLRLVFEHTRLCALTVSLFVDAAEATLEGRDVKKFAQNLKEAIRCEEMADVVRRSIVSELAKGVLPPISREDFIRLAGKIDLVADYAKDAVKILNIIKRKPPPNFRRTYLALTQCVRECALTLQEAIEWMNKDLAKSLEFTQQVEELEGQADERQLACLHMLSKLGERMGMADLLLWEEIIRHTEELADACEDASDVVKCIIMRGL
jgi:predicted phosphate transport protein (TIGR00153 family)